MPIWQLEPIDTESENWRTSLYKGKAIVRAPTERRARRVANVAFGLLPMQGRTFPIFPWPNPKLVSCEKIKGGKYKDSGRDAVLEPAEYDARRNRIPVP